MAQQENSDNETDIGNQFQTLEIDDLSLGEEQRNRDCSKRWIVVVRYVTAATMALVLSFFCPQTKLRTTHDDEADKLDYEILAELVAAYILTLIAMFAVQGSNPGYLTREIVSEVCQEDGLTLLGYEMESENGDENSPEANNRGDLMRRTAGNAAAASLTGGDVLSARAAEDKGECFRGTRRKVCNYCLFAPPLRAHHCRICNCCVATFDHHCTFLGTCIGERNHCRFWVFLAFQMTGFLVCSSIAGSSHLGFTTFLNNPSFDSGIVVITKIYLYPLAMAACVMCVSHSVFALLNLTTFECGRRRRRIDYLRGTRETDFPFSKGFDQNLRLFCCQRDAACVWLTGEPKWTPILWQTPGKIVRDSEDWWEHPWQNKYWSCC